MFQAKYKPMIENVLVALTNIIEDVCAAHEGDSVGMRRIKHDLATQLRERTQFMNNHTNDYYTPIYLCATYFSPKYSYAITTEERVVVAKYISKHVRLSDRYDFVFICSQKSVLTISVLLINRLRRRRSIGARRWPRRHSQ